MKLVKLKQENMSEYIEFYKNIYDGYDLKKDDMVDFLKDIILDKSVLSKRMKKRVVLIKDKEQPIMGAVLACVEGLSEYVQISFFESTYYAQEAFDLLLDEVVNFGSCVGAKYISGALNIHVNYGLGYLASNFNQVSSFGMNYNPSFYLDYFKNTGFEPIEMVTFKRDMSEFVLPISDRTRKKLDARYTVRPINFKKYKSEIETYTNLNNAAFTDHLFYYPRTFEEDYELYKPFKWLLKEENLLFVEKEGQPVGFMLWYPDYNELLKKDQKVSLKTVIDHKVLRKPISTFKIVEMGIIPSEQKRGAILALFSHLDGLVKDKYQYMESSWILRDNTHSANFGFKWAESESKKYVAYKRAL